jgi:hypothetical protein
MQEIAADDPEYERVKPIISQLTPFFHFDLATAVTAAETTAALYDSPTKK